MPFKVLCIEDNLDDKVQIQKALENKDFHFIWAKNGLTGVELAKSEQPDIILLDINLPDINGYEVARRLRNESTTLRNDTTYNLSIVPIIAVTANALIGDAELALAAGCDSYISKPINERELLARIELYLPSPDTI